MNNLKPIRAANNWSQADVARMMGCWQSNIVHYEKGHQNIPIDRARSFIKNAKAEYQVVLTLDQIYGVLEDIYPQPAPPKEGV